MNPVNSVANTAFALAYEWSPIIFTGGIFQFSPVGFPILAITQSLSVAGTLTSAVIDGGNIDPFAQPLFTWRPLPGSTLWEAEIAEYPFYTNQIAANAQVQRPLRVSMVGICPAGAGTPWSLKIATMFALRAVIQSHIDAGGTFTVVTPSYVYTNCLLTNFVDVSTGDTNQPQVAWQLDFVQPLIAFPEADAILNDFMGTISNGGQSLLDTASSLNPF
jgi:hypothetical protein